MLSTCPSCGRPNEAGAKFCSECGTALAARGVDGGIAPGRADASGERRQLTIMFCDLVGSTTLASRLDPEDTREVIGACLRMITQVVERFGGYVARYVGDGALIYFGYPQANEDDAERGVEAGLRIIEEAASLKLHDGFRTQFRVGIATGLVVVGDIVRAGAPGESDVAGETPHLAARLQALAEPDTVVISHGTRQLAGELFSYRDLGPVALKGFAEPVRAFEVLAPTGAESRFEALRVTRQSPLVGRDAELDRLEGLWRKACDGKGQVALLHGDPGIGKSRLTAMLSERIADQPHTRIRYYCSWHQQGSPFQPFINQLERAANIDRADTPAVKFDKLAQVLSPGSSQDEDLLLVADLLSVSPGEGPPIDLAPLKLRERTMEALLRQAALLSAQRPLLMVFEDVHWIDPSSLDLLKLAVQRIPELPILLIVTFRPAFQSPWSEEEAVSIPLSPLDRDESVALVQASAGPTELPPQVVAEIIERSDGIPLFVEELTRSVVDGRQGNGDGAATVPTTLHASLMSRLDRLGEAKAIALIGATIGREFTYELVAGLARRPEPELKVAFDQLTASGLVRRRGVPPAATYQFTHALLHEAAYRSMLRDTRRDLHADLAVILEDRFPETAKLRPDLLAHHCAEAGNTEKAIEYCLQAGRSAFARSAIVEAIGRLERGLELVGLLPEGERRYQLELGLYLYLTQALIAHTGYTSRETYEAVEHARRTADKLGEPPQLAAVLSGQWAYSLISNQLTTASRRSAELLDLGRARGDRIWTLLGLRASGVTDFARGRFIEARASLEMATQLYAPEDQPAYAALGVQDAQVVVTVYLSWLQIYLGYSDRGRETRDRAVTDARALNQAYSMAHALNGLAFTQLMLGQAEKALDTLDALERTNEEHGLAYYRAFVFIFRGWAHADLGNVAEGIRLIEFGISAYRGAGAHLYTTTFYRWLASAYRAAGDYRQGLAQLDEATSIAKESQAYGDEGEIHRVRAEILLDLNDRAGAEHSYRAALEASRRRQARQWELRAATGLARMLAEDGRSAEASSLLGGVHAWFTEGFDTPDLNAAKALLDELE
ncbi:adenylate/guanylate cyclase domain-containing protein [Bauldia litoralis]|uniref:Zinc-ribbon domain-containing protein n=1 Tax=Bauldia litoralis TaxID=665467 RepID=A0A1G6BTB3_9HYPH|nr:adenylate/guanylate cyclase domain-containing protein [Bauldia litoralis]SDB23869.1 zinc-ribbon domain-containing protein [Bauldia litoralis]